jgi:hypothetical protein
MSKPMSVCCQDCVFATLVTVAPDMLKVIEVIASATGDTDLKDAQELSQKILLQLSVLRRLEGEE